MSGVLRLEGQVVDQEQRPVSAARVRLEPGDRLATTDADGSFSFEALPSRRYWISVRHEELCAGPTLVRLAETNQRVTLRLRRGTTLIVQAFSERAPLVGAKVVVADEMLEATIDETGRAVVPGLAPHAHDVWIITRDFAVATLRMHPHTDPADIVEEFVDVHGGAQLEGIVLGPGAAPVADATVRFCSLFGTGWIDGPKTGRDGRWRLTLPEGRFRVAAVSAEYGPVADVDLQSDGRTPQRDMTLHVAERRHVSGVVVDENGAPVPHVWVGGGGAGGAVYSVCADETGAFTLRDLSLSAHHLYANTWDCGSASLRVEAPRAGVIQRLLRSVRRSEPITLTLQDARIAGHVRDERGEPLAGALVELFSSRGRNRFPMVVEADAPGIFDFGSFEPGQEYTLRAFSKDSTVDSKRADSQTVRAGTTDVKLLVGSGASIIGCVRLDGEPLTYFGVSWNMRDEFKGGRNAVRDNNGRFSIGGLEPGKWRLDIVAPGLRRKVVEEITIGRNEQIDLGDITVERAQPVAGYVRDTSGAVVADARVIIGHAPGIAQTRSRLDQLFNGQFEAVTNEAGRFQFVGVDIREEIPRAPLIWATHPRSGASALREVARGTSSVDLVLLGSGRIEGKVDGLGGGRPLVFARRPDEPEGARRQILTREGEFGFEDVPVGDYTISLSVPSTVETSTVTVAVAAGETAVANLVMANAGVRLTVKVPKGRGLELQLASADPGTPEPEQTKPRIIMRESTITVNGKLMKPPTGMESVSFDHLVPGKYRASIDGRTWTPIVVTSSPSEQSVEIKAE